MPNLTQEQRSKLPASEFAVPATRKLPIHDKQHVVLAWSASDQLKGDERLTAKRAILRKAHTIGVDTGTWHLQNIALVAMALDFGEPVEHSNRMPFTGVLAFVDEPSDKAPHGTNGKRVILSANAAREALPSLLGMAVDFKPDFDGHAARSKIGLITAADIEGNELKIAGYFWAADFPEEVSLIVKSRDKLGFSYECMSMMESATADPLVIAACEFTGAAVLYKDKAAYMKTSIAARADQGETTMDKDLEQALAALATSNTAIVTAVNAIPTAVGTAVTTALNAQAGEALRQKIEAGKAQIPVLRQNATSLRASGLETAAIELERQANEIESAVNAGKAPPERTAHHVAAAHQSQSGGGFQMPKELTDGLRTITDGVASMFTVVKDLSLKVEAGAGKQPERKTLTPATTAALAKIGLTASADGTAKISVAAFDAAATKAGLSSIESIAVKLALKEAGQLQMAA